MGRRIVMVKVLVATCPQLGLFPLYCIPQPAKDFDVVLPIYCLAWRSVFMVDNTFMIKKTVHMALTLLRLCCAFFRRGDSGDFHWEDGFCFRVIAVDP
jgi:hypothetical protein